MKIWNKRCHWNFKLVSNINVYTCGVSTHKIKLQEPHKTKGLRGVQLYSLYLTWLALPTTHIFRLFSPTWDYLPSISQDMFSDLIPFSLSLSLLLRLGIQLHFTTSMPVSLFTASQICYYQCEAKMKRPQIGVRRRISELLCVKSISFSFFSFFPFLVRYHIFWYGWNRSGTANIKTGTKHHHFCTGLRIGTKYAGHTGRYGMKLSSLVLRCWWRALFIVEFKRVFSK